MSKLIKTTEGIFKHNHIFSNRYSGVPYLYNKYGCGIIDGIERQHIDLYCKCDICGEEVKVARMHVDKNGIIYGANKK